MSGPMDSETPTPIPATPDRHLDHSRTQPLAGAATAPEDALSSPASLPERIVKGPDGVRLFWRLLLYFGLGTLTVIVLSWLGDSFFRDARSSQGANHLWGRLYSEFVLMSGAILPAFLVAR